MKQILWFALLHFIVLQVVIGLFFTAGHIPPKAMNLASVEEVLFRIQEVLVFPRWLLLKLWPWEHTPMGFGLFLAIVNSLVWGAVLAGLRNFWRKIIA